MTFQPKNVTGNVLASKEDDAMSEAGGPVVFMTQPLERPETLEGHTYKIIWPDSVNAIYITVNDVTQDDQRRPFEVFIVSNNMEQYA
tara:strand:+ start:162 stop:422 length:261 start_codon:yes stop_codon:yes gene_type:complete